jgi:hypothetical protein
MAYAIFRKTPIQGGKAISVRNVPGFGKRMTGTSNSNSGGVSYSAAIKRYDGGTGLADVYGSVMVAPGVVNSSADLSKVRIVQVASTTPSGPNILLNNGGNSQIQLTPLGVGNSIMIIR